MSINNKRRSKVYSEGLEHDDLNSNGYIADIESDSEIEEEEEEEEEEEGVSRKYPIELHTDSDTESAYSTDTEVGDWEYDRTRMGLYSDSDTESIDSMDTQVGSGEEEEEEEDRYTSTRAPTTQQGRPSRPRLIRQNAIQNLYKGGPSASASAAAPSRWSHTAANDDDNTLKPWLRLKNEQLK